MTIRKMEIDDYEEVVSMYYDFTTEVFSETRKISPKYFFYKEVMSWINDSKHIILSVKGNTITGFSLSYIDEFNSITESIYTCEIAYVKPEYRKGRSAYLLYKNGYNMSRELGLNLNTSGRISNGVSDMMKKHFGLEEKFINFERSYNG